MILGSWPVVENLVYVLVGLSAVYEIAKHKWYCGVQQRLVNVIEYNHLLGKTTREGTAVFGGSSVGKADARSFLSA